MQKKGVYCHSMNFGTFPAYSFQSQPMSKSKEEINKLIELNDELENYFRNTIIPQLFVDADLILRKFTPPAMKQFQLSDSDIGTHIDDISHRIRFPTFMENIKEVIETGEDFEKEIQTTDLRWFQMNILPYKIYRENRTNGVIITFVNITDRIKTLLEMEKLNADHETFIYSVSHDIKGPLNNLESLVDILSNITTHDSKHSENIIHMIVDSVGQLRNIINELTDITKIRHQVKTGGDQVDLVDIVEDVKLTLHEKIKDSSAKILTDLQVTDITFLKKNIRSIIYNLLSNAIKYRSSDRALEILIKTEQKNGFIVLSVRDNGIGIEENKLGVIFSEFSRVREEVEGTGVGLYIVSKMVENNGGEIKVESKVGVGSTFTIYFKS